MFTAFYVNDMQIELLLMYRSFYTQVFFLLCPLINNINSNCNSNGLRNQFFHKTIINFHINVILSYARIYDAKLAYNNSIYHKCCIFRYGFEIYIYIFLRKFDRTKVLLRTSSFGSYSI